MTTITQDTAHQIDTLRSLGFSVEQIEQITDIPAYTIREYLATRTVNWTPEA